MRKRVLRLLAILIALATVICGAVNVSASDSTTYTYTVSVNDDWVRTQDAYIPAAVYGMDLELSLPGDIFYLNNKLYISDTGNSRICVINVADSSVTFFGGEELISPDGLFVTDDGRVFVADPDAEAVFVYSPEYELIQTIGRPDSYLFSDKSLYNPIAVSVSSVGTVFVVGSGSYEGIMQFDKEGTFFGYFAANKYKMSLSERFEELVLNETQKDQLFVKTPLPIANIDISSNDLILSVTKSDAADTVRSASSADEALKMHNMAGLNIFTEQGEMKEEINFTDVAVGTIGNVYAVTNTGIINEYDNEGNLIFTFGGRALAGDRSGLFSNAVAIDIDKETGFLYVLDQERALVQVFYPTDFTDLTHQAIQALENGDYESSEEIWSSLLRLNGVSQIAHVGYGKSLFYQQEFTKALEHFKMANDREYYSDTMWELRNDILHNSMLYILIALIVLVVVSSIVSAIKKKRRAKLGDVVVAPKADTKFKKFWKELSYVKKMIRHPIDGCYYLRSGQQGSVAGATVLYILFFAIYLVDLLGRGFLFRSMDISTANPTSLIIMFWVPLILWIVGNYMIGTINEGEGSFKQIYVATAYSFAPYLLFTPVIIALSYVLTLNEAFVVNIGAIFIIAWTACLLFISVQEIQRYKFGETVRNILLVFFFMIMVVVAFSIVYLLFGQIVSFVKEIVGEGIYRVTN